MDKNGDKLCPFLDPLMTEIVGVAHPALPISARITERLVDVLLLASELRADLNAPEAEPLAWLTPLVERILADTDALLTKLAS